MVVEYGNDGGSSVEDSSSMVKGITFCALCRCGQLYSRAYGNVRRGNKKEEEIVMPR